jgi:hypothetical protein
MKISHSGGEEVDQVLVSEAHSTSAIDLNDIVTDSYSTSLCNGASCERTNHSILNGEAKLKLEVRAHYIVMLTTVGHDTTVIFTRF